MRFVLLVIYVLILLPSPKGLGQDICFQHIDQKEGLPTQAVYDIFQDSKGFIWIASDVGILRYDGYEFKSYRSDLQTSQPGSNISEDSKGRIWYQNFDGYVYYVEDDTLKALPQSQAVDFYPYRIVKDKLFIINSQGIEVFDVTNIALIKTIPLKIQNIGHCSSDSSRFYYIIDQYVFSLDNNLNETKSKAIPFEKEGVVQLYSNENSVVLLQKNTLPHTIYLYNESQGFIEKFSTNLPKMIQGFAFVEGRFWLLSPDGAYVFDTEGKLITTYFKGISISTVSKDREGNYWIGSTNQGIFLVQNLQNRVFNWDGFIPKKIIHFENGYLLGTHNDQLIKLDSNFRNTGVFTSFKDNSEVFSLYNDSISKNLFLVSSSFKVFKKGNRKISKEYTFATKSLCRISNNLYAFAASGLSGLLSTDLSSIDPRWKKFFDPRITHHTHKEISPISTNSRGKDVVYSVQDSCIYFATNHGLLKVDPEKTIELLDTNAQSILSNRLYSWGKNLYILNTKGELLLRKETGEISSLQSLLDIPYSNVQFIKGFKNKLVIKTQDRLLLMHSSDSIHFVEPLQSCVDPFEISDVLLEEERLLLITKRGLIVMPFRSQNQMYKPQLRVLEFLVNDERRGPIIPPTLTYQENSITLTYAVLSFGKTLVPKVMYKINQEAWKENPQTSRSLRLAMLAPGTYEILIKFEDDPESIKKISFEITPPFWGQTWFLICLLLAILFVAFIIYKVRIASVIKKNKLLLEKKELEQQLSQSMLTAIRSQMNPHFFFNALNTIQSYIFTNDRRSASSYLAKFSKLTRTILEMSAKEKISLSEEINALQLYLELEKMRFEEHFSYACTIDDSLDIEMVYIPSMIVQPYVENAVKHGLLHKKGDQKVELKFEKFNNQLVIHVIDNGIGRKKAEELNKIKEGKHRSFSSDANDQRLKILNKGKTKVVGVQIIDLYSKDGIPEGTHVILTLPIQNEAYEN